MDFSNLSKSTFVGNSTKHLAPYGIYEVNLTKIEKTELKGSKDPNAVYPVVALEFTGKDGVFSCNLFIPSPDSEDDMNRPTYKNDKGHEYQRPSRFENFQYTLMQIVHALNPEGEEKIKTNGSKIKTIDQFIELIIKSLNGKNKVNTFLKLVGRNNNGTVYAALPNACGLNKNGELFATNFIGEESSLFFSSYELTQQKKYQSATPTSMKEEETEDEESNDLEDLESLL